MTLNWTSKEYFASLICRDDRANAALEMLVDDLHAAKDRTIRAFLCHSGSEDFLWGLVRLLGSDNARSVAAKRLRHLCTSRTHLNFAMITIFANI